MHVGLDDIDIQIYVDGFTGGKTDVSIEIVCLILEVQLLKMFEHSLPIFLDPHNVELTKLKDDEKYILSLAEIRPDLHTNKADNNHKDGKLNQCYYYLIHQHEAEVLLEGLMKLDLGCVDHVIITRDQVIIYH